jgi:hypothetical protein
MATKIERTLVKADPGWSIALYFCDARRGERLVLHTVTAWAVIREETQHTRLPFNYATHDVEPIVIGGPVSEIDVPWALKRPDGLFQFLDGNACTEDQMMTVLREEEARQYAEFVRANRR